MATDTYGARPGISAKITETSVSTIVFGPEAWRLDANNLIIDSTTVDAGATPTTELRSGLLLGKQVTDGNLYEWDAQAVDGTEKVAGVLWRGLSMLDGDGVAEDKEAHVLLRGGLLVSQLLIKGTAFASHADEHIARVQLAEAGFVLDDDLVRGTFLGMPIANLDITAATVTPTVAQNGYRFILTNAASTTATLPTLEPGLAYEFLRVGNEEMVIASAAGDDMIVGNDLSADSVTFTTASEHIGARVRVESIRYGTTLKWLVTIIDPPFGTGATGGLTYSIAT